MAIFRRDGQRALRAQAVRSDVAGEFAGIGFARRRIFIVAVHLCGDDLPLVRAMHPGIDLMVPGRHVLPEDRFCFVQIVTENGRVTDDAALRPHDLDGA